MCRDHCGVEKGNGGLKPGRQKNEKMRKRAIYRLGVYILAVHMLLANILWCSASENGPDEKPASAISSVSVSPGSTVVSKGSTYAFVAYVTGRNDYSQEVVWSVHGQTSQSTFIDGKGILNVGSDETSPSLIVKAVSRQDSSYSATALATVQTSNYTIQGKASPDNGGTVSGSGTVQEGGYTVLEAVAKDGYQFDYWMENGTIVSTERRLELNNITGSRELTAMFSKNRFDISFICWPAGAGTVSGQGTYDKGSSVTMKAEPAGGYRFVNWSENGNILSTEPEYSVNNISRDMNFLATFDRSRTYAITASVSSFGGTVVPEGRSTVSEGSGVSYVVIPEDGYVINAVYVDGKSVGAVSSYSFSDVKKDHTISADFVAASVKNDDENKAKSETVNKPEDEEGKADQTDEAEKASDPSSSDEDRTDAHEDEPQVLTGTLKYLDISVQEAERMIQEKDDMKLLAGALETGDLQMTVRNDFADKGKEISSIANYEGLLDDLLTEEEKLEMVQGKLPVTIDFQIKAADEKEKESLIEPFEENKLPGMTIGQYFTMHLVKTGQDDVQSITEIPQELKIVLNIPGDLRTEKRKFYVLRLYTAEDGSLDFAQLLDEDDNPDTITFSTDRITDCAIAYIDWASGNAGDSEHSEDAGGEKGMINVIGIMAVALAAAVTLLLLWRFTARKRR